MNLFDRSIQDAKLLTNRDFAIPISFVAPTSETSTINGWTSQHHIDFDTDGNMVNSKKVHVTISESDLTDANYPVRNTYSEVYLKNHLVTVKNSTQNTKQFKVAQWFQDERLGLITIILQEYV